MIKNKAFHAMIIGTCIFVNSIAGVYADTTAPDTPVSIQIEQVQTDDQILSYDPLTNRQSEIDKYVFEKNAKDFTDKGITVTHTGVIGDSVEVGITPFNDENAKYVYDVLGKDMINVVEGMQATTLDADDAVPEYLMYASAPPVEEKTSTLASFFDNIWEWIKNIF